MLRRLAYLTSSGLLKLSLFMLALAGAGWLTFGEPGAIKQAADDGGLYGGAVTNILDHAKKDVETSDTYLALDDPEIEKAARDAFPPQLLKQQGESVIDGIYAWLQGETDKPAFSIDLTEAKQRFATNVGNYAQRRYDALPPCTIQQLQTHSTNVDPFTVQCQAPGLSGATVNEIVKREILQSDQFLADTSYTAEDLPKDSEGRTVLDNLEPAPEMYQFLGSLPLLLGFASAIAATGVILLAEDKRRGLKAIGVTLVGTGIFLGLGALIISWSFNQMNGTTGEAFQNSLVATVRSLTEAYNGNLLKFYLTYLLVGAAILITLHYQKRRNISGTDSLK